MKITITGGSGFLGSHVADELSKIGHEVKIFDKKKSKWLKSDQKMYVGDILNQRSLERAVKGADIVFHFAALSDLEEAFKRAKKSEVTYVISIKTHSYQWLEGSAYWESPTLEIPNTKENEEALNMHKEGKAKQRQGV